MSFGAVRRGEPGKNRPAIVVSSDRIMAGAPHETIVVVPLSSSMPPSALRPEVVDVEGVDRPSSAIPRAVRGVARSRFLRPLGKLSRGQLAEVERALAVILDLTPPAPRRRPRKRPTRA